MYIDTHAHLTDEQLSPRVNEVINGWREQGVGLVINIGYSLESSKKSAYIAQNTQDVYFMAGIHPDDAGSVTEDALAEIEKLTAHQKCVAIGEIGLDYHYGEDRQMQMIAFEKQLALAQKLGLPVSIHARDCTADMLAVVERWYKKLNGIVLHCYSMGAESAKQFAKYGCYFAFGGAITFKNNKQIYDVAKVVPANRLLTETDCPYMAPTPYRGKVNEPKYIPFVLAKLAELYGMEDAKMQEVIKENTLKVFNRIKL